MDVLLPARPEHPLGCHRPRVPDRSALDAAFFVLRTGFQWNALNDRGICSSSSARRRFQERAEAGAFEMFWREGLLAYDAVKGIDWTWLSLDGAMAKAPLGGEKTGPNPTDRGKRGVKRSVLTDGRGTPIGVAIAGANRNDHLLMRDTLDGMGVEGPGPTTRRKRHPCVDKGHDYAETRRLAAAFGFTLHLRTRGEEAKAKRHRNGKARRRVVEAARSWTDRFRDLLIRRCKKPENYLALVHFAFGTIAWRQCLPGQL